MDGHHSGTQNWFDWLHPETGEWQVLPDAPNRRDHAPVAIVGNKLYYFGGRETGLHDGTDYEALFYATISDVDVYDFATGTWSVHDSPLPVETAAGGVGVLNGKFITLAAKLAGWKPFRKCRYSIRKRAVGRWGRR